MATPTGITLRQGEVIVEPVTSTGSGVNSKFILTGVIVQAYSNQMRYSLGQQVSFFNSDSKPFTQNGNNFILINQSQVFFKLDYIP